MKIKRFVAQDMRRAMRMVRDEQGPDAVILSNRRVDEGIEVVTAIDYDASLLSETPTSEKALSLSKSDTAQEASHLSRSWSDEPSLLGMKQEVASLRRLLESQLASLAWNDKVRRHPVRAGVLRKLETMGVDAELALSISDHCDSDDIESGFASALQTLDQQLPTLAEEIIDKRGAVALVGPTGVGKTTSIAKLAARFALKYGAGEMALLTTDGFRIGAQEQLMTFGRLLGVPVQLVRDAHELRTALEALQQKRLVLIDSAGISQRDQRINDELGALRQSSDAIHVLLTLACNAQSGVLDETMRSFADLDPCACVLTKIDEAACLGGAISALVRHQLPLAYVTDGQNVPEDLHWARSRRLALIERAVNLGAAREEQRSASAAICAPALTYSEVAAHA